MINYSHEVEKMCCVAKGPHHGPAPIPEEGNWVKAYEIKDISGFSHGIGWCAPQQGTCKLTLNIKDGIVEEYGLLVYISDEGTQVANGDVADVSAIDSDTTSSDIVETGDKVYKGRFTRAVMPENCDVFPPVNCQINVMKGRSLTDLRIGVLIGKA